jgi:hypothetical protein
MAHELSPGRIGSSAGVRRLPQSACKATGGTATWRPLRESRSAAVLEEVSQMSASRTKLELALTSKNSHKTCADILFQIADPALAT